MEEDVDVRSFGVAKNPGKNLVDNSKAALAQIKLSVLSKLTTDQMHAIVGDWGASWVQANRKGSNPVTCT